MMAVNLFSSNCSIASSPPVIAMSAVPLGVSLPSGVTLNTTNGLITCTTGVVVGNTVVSLQIFNSEGWSTNPLTINATA